VTREIGQAIPISGSFIGAPNENVSMTVEVMVASTTEAALQST
jgi:hypothetical protein